MAVIALPPVPPALAERGIGLRRQGEGEGEGEGERAFLARLYVSARWEELALSGWSERRKTDFLTQQFRFQDAHYARYYPEAARGIVLDRAEPVGRLYLLAMVGEVRIVDISLLPSHRRRGIGAALIGAVFGLGDGLGLPVTIHVEVFNHEARRLYDRLGFVEVGGDQVHRKMARAASVS